LFGIDIAVDWSWGLIVLLITWNLTEVFLRWHPSWSLGMSFSLAVVAALLFFSSVLAHELAHSLVAGGFGVEVHEIRLFLFGGVSNLDREPPSASAEFWIAIVGPLVSFALGLAFSVVAMAMMPVAVDPTASPWDTMARLGPIGTLFFWLGPINILVGAFNLIPGFPLDGGRILRAALWRMTGSLHKATLVSSLVGRGIGWAFIFMGIAMIFGARIPFFGQGPLSGTWLAFIGWFLSSAAHQSYGALLVHDVLDGVRISALMRRHGPAVPPSTSVSSLVNDWFMRSSERSIPVTQDGRLVGLVGIGDVSRLPREAWDRASVSEIMTPRERIIVAAPKDEALSALRKFAERDVEQLPILEGEELVGTLSRSEIARWLELHLAASRRFGAPHAV
ncbi:MAG: peptidase, partial [Myxococcaceae bacterium]|nr:peptidase [Myxococcaceae bacterium]